LVNKLEILIEKTCKFDESIKFNKSDIIVENGAVIKFMLEGLIGSHHLVAT